MRTNTFMIMAMRACLMTIFLSGGFALPAFAAEGQIPRLQQSLWGMCANMWHAIDQQRNVAKGGLAVRDIQKIWTILAKDPARAIAFYRNPDVSFTGVGYGEENKPLKQMVSKALLLLFKDMPEAVPYWDTLRQFSAWYLADSDGPTSWHSVRSSPDNTIMYNVEVAPNRDHAPSLKIGIWDVAAKETLKLLRAKIWAAEALVQKLYPTFSLHLRNERFGSTVTLLGLNDANIAFIEGMINLEGISSDDALRAWFRNRTGLEIPDE